MVAAAACVLPGEAPHYGRLGCKIEPELRLEAAPPQYFIAQAFATAVPRASVTYHPAFNPERNPHVPR